MGTFRPPDFTHIPKLPDSVHVVNLPSAESVHTKLRNRDKALRADLKEGETLVFEYHTPAGEVIYVGDVGYYRDQEALIFQGYDSQNNLCQIIVPPHAVQVIFRVVKTPAPSQQKKRIGFYVHEDTT
jgi:hypothetical protein